MITYYRKNSREKEVKELKIFESGAWIYAENPDESELDFLSEEFELNPDLLHDALDPYEVPRLETVDGILYIYIRFPYKSGEKIMTVPVLIALGDNFVLTVCSKPLPFMARLFQHKKDFVTNGRIRFLTSMLVEIDEDYNLFLTRISRSIRSIRVQIEDIDNRDIIRFVYFEETINDLLASLVPMSTILQRVLFNKHLQLKDDQKEAIDDIYLSTQELQELSRTNLKAIVNIREGYSTIMTNNLNRVIKLLTVLTIVLTVPTIIGSLYGMNVALPLDQHPYAFWIVLGIISVTSVLITLILKWKKWL